MKNKILPLTLAMLGCLALPASGYILVPNGDFSNGSQNWLFVGEGTETPAVTFPTGGNPGGYGTISQAGGWGILVSPTVAGALGGGIPIASLGLTAGSPVTFRWDSINLGAPGSLTPTAGPVAGMKVEAWANNALVGNTGDRQVTPIGGGSTWQTYTTDWVLPANAQNLIFVPLNNQTAGTVIGIDNVGVVPEPSTYALLALGAAGLGAHLVRRRRR